MASKKSKVELKRININLPIDLVENIEKFSVINGINMTTSYIILLRYSLLKYTKNIDKK